MSVTKTEIFIASRFEEFADLRRALKERINSFTVFELEAVDLNDNVAHHAPPLGKCLASVKRAEVMILLIGETYGGSPAGEELSYTHLEYHAAVQEDSNTVVLPFFIGSSFEGNKFSGYSPNKKLAAWQKEVINTHTPAFFHSSIETKELCSLIFDAAYKALYEARSVTVQELMDRKAVSDDLDPEYDGNSDVLDESGRLSHEEMERLDNLFHGEGDATFDSAEGSFGKNTNEILLRPAEAAALEQKKEAFKAVELGERFIAIRHLRKALEHHPLDFSTTYWLSRLLASSGKNNNCRDAIRYALFAARMASYDQRPVKASFSLLIAAKAASALGEYDEALEYARRAVLEAPWLATAHINLATQLAGAGQVDEALKEVRNAFQRMPQIILAANREPALVRLGKRYLDLKKSLKENLVREAMLILQDKIAARQALAGSEDEAIKPIQNQLAKLPSKPLLNVYFEGREAANRQLDFLQQQAQSLSNVDDHAVADFYSHHIEEHDRSQRYNNSAMQTVSQKRNGVLVRLLAGIGVLFFFFMMFLKARQPSVNSNPTIIPILLMAVAAIYVLIKGKEYISHCNHYAELQERAKGADSVKASISKKADQIRHQASAQVEALCRSIMAFDRHVMQSSLLKVGRSIKGATSGDVVAIDTVLQADVLNGAEIDEAIVPESLASHCTLPYPHEGRIRLYCVVENRKDRLVLSRSAVFFWPAD